jgi:predicted SprT family Zn-dependent metalloprotease
MTELLDRWGNVWGLPSFSSHLQIRFSDRLSHSLGRTRPLAGRITLAGHLRDPEKSCLFESVLCHEAAHVAVAKLFGPGKKPHGLEWASLVREAGEEPNVHVIEQSPGAAKTPRKRIWKYVHRCSVCQATRTGFRPVAQWRCVECTDLGLPGNLSITRQRIETDTH